MTNDEIIVNVGENDFQEKVIEASRDRVVVVDFWASWCQPCRMLSPVLERVVSSFYGQAILAKVNTEEHPMLARQWGIQGIPAVKIFKDGNMAAEFVGVQPEPVIRDFIAPLITTEADSLSMQGDSLLDSGKISKAKKIFKKAIAFDDRHEYSHARLAYIAVEEGNIEEAKKHASYVNESSEAYGIIEAVMSRIYFMEYCKENGGQAYARKAAVKNPENLENRFRLACCLAAEVHYIEAIDELLYIIEKNKKFNDDIARKTILKIFDILGPRDPVTEKYRSKLSRLVF